MAEKEVNSNFFDNFTAFYETGMTGTRPDMLNNRYNALIKNNKNILKDAVILDLASHDGRWSFAALKTGAKKVIGFEAEDYLVERCLNNMKNYGITDDRYSFTVGDLFEGIRKLKPGDVDVVFCFGIFYHIINHMDLIREIKRIEPKYLILDTEITLSKIPIVRIRKEQYSIPDPLIPNERYIVGRPSKSGIEMMLDAVNFDYQYYDWSQLQIKDWGDLEIYASKKSILIKKIFKYIIASITNSKKRKSRQDLIRYVTTKRVTIVAKNLSRKTEKIY